MKTIKCFEVLGHTDTTEGRGPMKTVARFSNYEAAEQYVKSKQYAVHCVMGYHSKDDIHNIREITISILDTVDELVMLAKENLKTTALAKLTKEEREALGI